MVFTRGSEVEIALSPDVSFRALELPSPVNEISLVSNIKAGKCELFVAIWIIHITKSKRCGSHQLIIIELFVPGRTACVSQVQEITPYCDIH